MFNNFPIHYTAFLLLHIHPFLFLSKQLLPLLLFLLHDLPHLLLLLPECVDGLQLLPNLLDVLHRLHLLHLLLVLLCLIGKLTLHFFHQLVAHAHIGPRTEFEREEFRQSHTRYAFTAVIPDVIAILVLDMIPAQESYILLGFRSVAR